MIEGIHKLLNTPNIHFDDKELVFSALYLFEKNNIDFIDAYNAAVMKHKTSALSILTTNIMTKSLKLKGSSHNQISLAHDLVLLRY